MKFRKRPVVIEATQWFKNGDHPDDKSEILYRRGDDGSDLTTEGKVVRWFRRPDVARDRQCERCNVAMHNHGWIDTLEGGHIVCPGDWIITGVHGERYPCKPDIFAKTYEADDGIDPADELRRLQAAVAAARVQLKEAKAAIGWTMIEGLLQTDPRYALYHRAGWLSPGVGFKDSVVDAMLFPTMDAAIDFLREKRLMHPEYPNSHERAGFMMLRVR